ncbi:hypothetical protein DIPPA_09293 [Diplonema papillatum]|nr:hypothetical protein DIPPA_09293 [Diplonema papillatum]
MGCGITKEEPVGSTGEALQHRGGVVASEPGKLRWALRLKRYEVVSGVKLAFARDLYDDGLSRESLTSVEERRVAAWMDALPEMHDDLQQQHPATKSVRTASDNEISASTCSEALSEAENTPLPACLYGSKSDELITRSISPERLQSHSQLVTLERVRKAKEAFKLGIPYEPSPATTPVTRHAPPNHHHALATHGSTDSASSDDDETPVPPPRHTHVRNPSCTPNEHTATGNTATAAHEPATKITDCGSTTPSTSNASTEVRVSPTPQAK